MSDLPFVPTSLATRVTSAAKIESLSIISLIVLQRAAISPAASIWTLTPRLPLATAVVAFAMLLTCSVIYQEEDNQSA